MYDKIHLPGMQNGSAAWNSAVLRAELARFRVTACFHATGPKKPTGSSIIIADFLLIHNDGMPNCDVSP